MSCNNIVLHLDQGERRRIQLDVYSCKNEPFVILDAAYEITGIEGEIIASGSCIISDKMLSFMYDAKEKGSFGITITLTIADEIIKEKMVIYVS